MIIDLTSRTQFNACNIEFETIESEHLTLVFEYRFCNGNITSTYNTVTLNIHYDTLCIHHNSEPYQKHTYCRNNTKLNPLLAIIHNMELNAYNINCRGLAWIQDIVQLLQYR